MPEMAPYDGPRDAGGLVRWVRARLAAAAESPNSAAESPNSAEIPNAPAADRASTSAPAPAPWPVNGAVVHLDDDSFRPAVAAASAPTAAGVLTMFYAPWCSHCAQFKPAFAKASTVVRGEGIVFAAVDCVANKVLCRRQGVKGYPTLVWHSSLHPLARNGTGGKKYESRRSMQKVVAWARQQSRDAAGGGQDDAVAGSAWGSSEADIMFLSADAMASTLAEHARLAREREAMWARFGRENVEYEEVAGPRGLVALFWDSSRVPEVLASEATPEQLAFAADLRLHKFVAAQLSGYVAEFFPVAVVNCGAASGRAVPECAAEFVANRTTHGFGFDLFLGGRHAGAYAPEEGKALRTQDLVEHIVPLAGLDMQEFRMRFTSFRGKGALSSGGKDYGGPTRHRVEPGGGAKFFAEREARLAAEAERRAGRRAEALANFELGAARSGGRAEL
jgi:thiol-disulfide isomerase/thioredoxin